MKTNYNNIKFAKRKMTICRKSFTRSNKVNIDFPIITLCGKWLEDSGFEVGHVIVIHCSHQKLIITISEKQRYRCR